MLHDTKNKYSLYGMGHFKQKYKIFSKKGDVEEPKICVVYGNLISKEGDFTISVLENNIQNEIVGYTIINDKEIPLFEKPVEPKIEGEPLLTFSDGDQTYPCVLEGDKKIIIYFDLFQEIGYILSGHMEQIWKSQTEEVDHILEIPIVDAYEELLYDLITLAHQRIETSTPSRPLWPNGKKFAVCLTHDVDRVTKTYQYITHFFKHLKNGELSDTARQILSFFHRCLGDEPYWNFEKIIEIERNLGVKSTFFFLDEKQKPKLTNPRSWSLFVGRYRINDTKIKKIMQKLHLEGCEIGLHGSYDSYEDGAVLMKEKNDLEDIIGKEITGIRQHHLNLKIPRTWELQKKAGFKYDTTLGFRDKIGFRWGTCFPFHPFDNEQGVSISILEIPLIMMDGALFYMDMDTLEKRKNAWKECETLIDTVEKYRGVLTILWHQRFFNRKEFPEWVETYIQLINLCKERGGWVTTANEISKWWGG